MIILLTPLKGRRDDRVVHNWNQECLETQVEGIFFYAFTSLLCNSLPVNSFAVTKILKMSLS